jgi:hypothetical protein
MKKANPGTSFPRNFFSRNFVPCFFAAGILAVLLAGCFNPITVFPPEAEETGWETPKLESFTVDVLVGKDAGSRDRSVAGPDTARIKGGPP